MRPTKILITGANGQVGTALAEALRNKFGDNNVLCLSLIHIFISIETA